MSPFEEAPEEFDQTIFAVTNKTIGAVEGLTLKLVKDQQRYNDDLMGCFFSKLKHTRYAIVLSRVHSPTQM